MITALNQLVAERLSKDDLLILCHNLNVDYDEVAHSSRQITAINLQEHMQNRSSMSRYLAELRRWLPQEIDLNPYLYYVIEDVFPTEIGSTHLLAWFGYRPHDFPNQGNWAIGIRQWRLEKAQHLQAALEANGRICELLDLLRETNDRVDLSFYRAKCDESLPEMLAPEEVRRIAAQAEETTPTAEREAADQYENFDISIVPLGNGRFRVDAESPAGEDGEDLDFDLQNQELNELLAYMRGLVAGPSDVQRIGNIMRNFLFPPRVWSLYERSRDTVQLQGKAGLRIRLRFRLDQGKLMQIPWEYCRDDRDYFALNSGTPVVRYLKTNRAAQPISLPDTVRILVAIASPANQPTIDVDGEIERIEAALGPYRDQGRIDLRIMRSVTQRDLTRELSTRRGFRPHIFHYIGHGVVGDDGQGALMLEDGSGQSDPANAQVILRWLRDRTSETKIVVLNACLTAAYGSDEAIIGIAPRLVWDGIPAVVASQFAIPDKTARAFAEDFYGSLVDGVPLDMAITEARRLSSSDDEVFWGIPVLFMRAPDGVIWQHA